MQQGGSVLHRLTGATGRRLVVAVPLAWLAVFFLLPLLETLQVSFTTAQRSIPPYAPCLLYTSPSPRDRTRSRMPSSA